jgi:lysophospholipase L1-like esterase
LAILQPRTNSRKLFQKLDGEWHWLIFFNQDVKIDNRALNGRSTKSFINEKRWDAVLTTLKAGDYVLIEFGHNDEKTDKPEIGTSLAEYKTNLIRYVKETQDKKSLSNSINPNCKT